MRALTFSVHILTAAGAALALLSLLAAVRGEWALMFAWLGGALIVDAVDGPLARRLDVAAALPRWSGDVIDLVVDFTTYVFVPAYAIASGGLMPEVLAIMAGVVIVVTGALYFADRRMKTADNFFRGFPALWNVVAFYLLLLRPPVAVCAVAIALLAILTFAPIRFVHPIRVRRWRPLTVALTVAWAVLALIAVLQGLTPSTGISAALCVIAAYFVLVGLLSPRPVPT